MTLLITIAVALTVILFLSGSYYAFSLRRAQETHRVKERLRTWADLDWSFPVPDIIRKRVLSEIPAFQDLLTRFREVRALERLLAQANSEISVGAFLLLSAFSAGGIGLGLALVGHAPFLMALCGAALGGLLPTLVMRGRKKQRLLQFERQLPDALDAMTRALQAGHTFMVGIQMVGEEFADPIAPEFRKMFEEITLGMSVTEALQNLCIRVDCPDLKFFMNSVIIQRETGGNLSEIFESISNLVRQRFELQAKVQALSAEGKLSAYVLFALPIVIGLLLQWVNPEYLLPLYTDPIGQRMLLAGVVMMLFGLWVTRRMIAIKV